MHSQMHSPRGMYHYGLLLLHDMRPLASQWLSEAEHSAGLVLVTKDQQGHALQVVVLASLALLAPVAPVDEGLAATVGDGVV